MSALTLTALAENIFRARDTVARELVGFIPSVLTNTDSDQVSTGGTVDSIVTSQPTVNTSITPAMTIPNGDAQTIGVKQLTLDSAASVRIPMTGENARKLSNIGQYSTAVDQMFAQAIRGIVNAIEAKIGVALSAAASRATGTAGTTPFGTNFNVIADARKILVDNGVPQSDLSLVIDSSAGTKLRQIAGLWQANTAGTDSTLRSGALLDMYGLAIRESANVAAHTKGAGVNAVTTAALAIGDTAIPYGTMTANTTGIKAGDIITMEGDSVNTYVVTTGATAASGTITIAAPGLRVAAAEGDTITVGGSHTANIGLHRLACELAIRPVADPIGGDAAVEQLVIADDRSPLVFTVHMYKGYHAAMMEVSAIYGVKVWKPEFVAKLLG
jgi:hypothetical protein